MRFIRFVNKKKERKTNKRKKRIRFALFYHDCPKRERVREREKFKMEGNVREEEDKEEKDEEMSSKG